MGVLAQGGQIHHSWMLAPAQVRLSKFPGSMGSVYSAGCHQAVPQTRPGFRSSFAHSEVHRSDFSFWHLLLDRAQRPGGSQDLGSIQQRCLMWVWSRSGAVIRFTRQCESQHSGRERKGLSWARSIPPPRAGRELVYPICIHGAILCCCPSSHLPPETGWSRTHTESSFPKAVTELPSCLSQVQLCSLTCSLVSPLADSRKSLPPAVSNPGRGGGDPAEQ